jgi:predicted ATPase
MRSVLGLLIPLVTDHYCISLIDEPEAFLHPPRARTLGTEVANLASTNESQLLLATHDKNFLQGLVESGAPVTVVHLTREGDDTGTATGFATSTTTLGRPCLALRKRT